jgi:hypothetical protein
LETISVFDDDDYDSSYDRQRIKSLEAKWRLLGKARHTRDQVEDWPLPYLISGVDPVTNCTSALPVCHESAVVDCNAISRGASFTRRPIKAKLLIGKWRKILLLRADASNFLSFQLGVAGDGTA